MTTQEQLKVIIQAMIDGGWCSDIVSSREYVCFNNPNKPTFCTWIPLEFVEYSFPDLLVDASAMEAAFGGEAVCSRCGGDVYGNDQTHPDICWHCDGMTFIPVAFYRAKEAFRIIYNGGDGVSYLYDALIKIKPELAATAGEE